MDFRHQGVVRLVRPHTPQNPTHTHTSSIPNTRYCHTDIDKNLKLENSEAITGRQDVASGTLSRSFANTPRALNSHDQHRHTTPPEKQDPFYKTTEDSDKLITQLQIRVAVLENDLAHATKARDEIKNGSLMIAEALASALAARGETQISKLENEIRMLRGENAVLWHRIESKSSNPEVVRKMVETSWHEACKKPAGTCEFSGRNEVSPIAFEGLFDPSKSWPPPRALETSRGTIDQVVKSEAALPIDGKMPVDTTFNSNSPTVPNTPTITEAQQATLNLSQAVNKSTETPSKNVFRDVGTFSLEETFNSNMDDFPPAQISTLYANEGLDIDEQIEKQMSAMNSLANLPKPCVLKVGSQIKGSFLGHEYDAKKEKARAAELEKQHQQLAPYPQTFERSYNARDNQVFVPQGTIPTGPRAERGEENGSLLPTLNAGQAQLWANKTELDEAVKVNKRWATYEDRRYPSIFRFGIRYIPDEDDTNYFRTITITNLSISLSLWDILSRVRGGMVVSAVLAETASIIGSNTAVIQFLSEAAAAEYHEYTTSHPFTIASNHVITELVMTPTYPWRPYGDQTRVLALPIVSTDFSITNFLHDVHKLRAPTLLCAHLVDTHTLILEFSSIEAAGSAFGYIRSLGEYRELPIYFAPDPCAGPVEELALPAPKRPDPIPAERLYPGHNIVDQMITVQRKRLAALDNQPVVIPSFSGKNIKSSNWADEVNEELGELDTSAYTQGQDESVIKQEDEDEDTIQSTTFSSGPAPPPPVTQPQTPPKPILIPQPPTPGRPTRATTKPASKSSTTRIIKSVEPFDPFNADEVVLSDSEADSSDNTRSRAKNKQKSNAPYTLPTPPLLSTFSKPTHPCNTEEELQSGTVRRGFGRGIIVDGDLCLRT